MAINPVQFADHVNEQFLRYQLTAFPITDPDLFAQAQEMLGDRVNSPLIKGPYVSIAKSFKFGPNLPDLAEQGIVHPALPDIAQYESLFAHQWETLKAAQAGNHCLIATGTGSGKTEAFLYPIIDHCLQLRDAGKGDGVAAILVYPMNALAIDQLGRLRHMLAGTGISFGMYIGSTPSTRKDTPDYRRLAEGQGRAEYAKQTAKLSEDDRTIVSPWEERVSEQEMQEHPPRLLLTNVYQLELLLTRGKDLGMFVDPPLKFLVFDEAHTYNGAMGAETACLIRRLRAFCRKSPDEVICIGTSATITDRADEAEGGAAAKFAYRFFGVDPERVTLVQEEYEEQEWPDERRTPDVPEADTLATLQDAIEGIEEEDDRAIARAYQELTGDTLSGEGDLYEELFDRFKGSELAYQICDQLSTAKHIEEAVDIIWRRVKRKEDRSQQAQAELLCYLALGAAARRGNNTLMRPKVHYFVRGLGGAVVTFENDDEGQPQARLYFRGEGALDANPNRQPTAVFPIWVCKNCGQHYYRAWVEGLDFDGGQAIGGQAEGENVVWAPAPEEQGGLVTFTDRFVSENPAAEVEAADVEHVAEKLDRQRTPMHICQQCGALHLNASDQCAQGLCERAGALVPVDVLTFTGDMARCPACSQQGSRFGGRVREPIRPMRATVVADVHILAQDMLGAAEERRRKLICFADNRQDAAFQAGWMRDHARRYRMRHLIYEYLRDAEEPTSIGDVQAHLYSILSRDRDLRLYLAPEVFEGTPTEHFGRGWRDNLNKYLRITLLREFATSFKQRDSLETWGVARVVYGGLEDDAEVATWADELGVARGEFIEGISALVDVYRRNTYFHDEAEPIFSRWWREGDEEIMRGYLPFRDYPPHGLTLTHEDATGEKLTQFISERGQTLAQNLVSKWWPEDKRPEPAQIRDLLRRLWDRLTELEIIRPVNLVTSRGNTLRGTAGAHQVSSAAVGIVPQRRRFKCNVCQRVHTRPTPRNACTAMHCHGTLVEEEPPNYDYNVASLDQPFWALIPEEHTAQVPSHTREAMEREFKQPAGRVNCFVATPTLELGVNIGDLDMILMRNVPPRPSNYWQRAGRAGREHRMAVAYTYCRPSIHDEYFFEDPYRLLAGDIEPPSFNLKNDVLLRKHLHALALSELIRLSRSDPAVEGMAEADIEELTTTLPAIFPDFINQYLYVHGRRYRAEPYDVSQLNTLVSKHRDRLLELCTDVFAEYWPEEATEEVTQEALGRTLDEMGDRLQRTVTLLHKRMMWAVQTRRRLLAAEEEGLLDDYEERLRQRCENYLHQLRERSLRNYTLTVLGFEGFLPGYGAYEGSIVAFPQRAAVGARSERLFELSRPPALAVREFVPGNLIYANRGRYRVGLYHFPVGEHQLVPETYTVDPEHEVLCLGDEAPDGYASDGLATIEGLPICDCDLAFMSSISDEEDYRFQLPAKILGKLLPAHNGGVAYSVGRREFRHMFGQRMRLVNLGPADRVAGGELGYPVCRVCGAVRSPYASESDLEHFRDIHSQRCGQEPGWLALSAEAQVDGFVIPGCDERGDAVNLGESLRIGAEQTMEMDSGDLQYIPIATGQGYELFLYDTMPGGSGLLGEMIERWQEVIEAARHTLSNCPQGCDSSCYECMRTYYNLPYHRELDRQRAVDLLGEMDIRPERLHSIPPVADTQTGEGTSQQSNADRLLRLILRAGFPEPDREQRIHIGKPYDNTAPDLSYCSEDEAIKVAIYLDGLSKNIHGNAQQQQMDRTIRSQLELEDWEVIEIASSDLDDIEAMRLAFRRLAKALNDRRLGEHVREEDAWFDEAGE